MEIKQNIKALLDLLNNNIYEKHEVIALSLLSAVAGESIFLLGAPGVAKSLIARQLKFAFEDGSKSGGHFEYLMNRFSTPDEIFGPVSISQLKDNDKYERLVKKYLPGATVVFLDEIWKAGPSIQNALLTVLNEKVYRNGEEEILVPMKALISASNELPMKDEGLEALWDRFLIRYVVEGIVDVGNFNEMISKSPKIFADPVDAKYKISNSEYESWSTEINSILIPESIFNVIHVIRSYIQKYNEKVEQPQSKIYISDRRWKKIVRLLRTSAFLNDRKTVDLMDCFLIGHCIWNQPEQYSSVMQFVKDAVEKHGYKLDIDLSDLQDEIADFEKEVSNYCNYIEQELIEIPKVFYSIFYNVPTLSKSLIKITDFESLDGEYKKVQFFNNSADDWSRRNYSEHYTIKVSSKLNNIVLDGKLHKVEVDEKNEIFTRTRKPTNKLKTDWDKRIKVLLTKLSNLKSQVDHFRKNDLQHLRVNLFVNPALADIVEANLTFTDNEINQLEIETKRVQHYYENIEDQSQAKEIKQLTTGKV